MRETRYRPYASAPNSRLYSADSSVPTCRCSVRDRRGRRSGRCGGVRSRVRGGAAARPCAEHRRYTAPDGDRDGSLVFTTDVTVSSGIRHVKVLAWPTDSPLADKELTTKDMAEAEPATCAPSGEDTVRCTYTVAVTGADAAEFPRGPWHVAVLARADDGSTTLDPKAARFTVG
ncbi:DUF5707 domain-containing protein [Streptomyces niveus]|uniref:DUF5707 domain-containing protein n=1 Tax=Streptomyces niveus TaxID=193462 RepID=UPI00369E50D8